MLGTKKVVILQTSGNELANQLWNYISIYAYTTEAGYDLENPAFFEYGNYFTMPKPNKLFAAVFFTPFTNYTKRKTAFRRKLWRKLYFWYADAMFRFFANNLVSYSNAGIAPYYLPPTKESSGRLRELEDKKETIYFNSWLFRNPLGIEKYRSEIKAYFKPRKDIETRVFSKIKKWREHHKTLVGIHIRQGDYRTWMNGDYFIEQTRVREIIDEYISFFKKNKEEILFIITSDGPVEEKNFEGLSFAVSNDNAVADLFLLSSTDIIIGSDSTFGAFASYYGNIPFVTMTKKAVDWEYYYDKTKFFENKYSTVVHY